MFHEAFWFQRRIPPENETGMIVSHAPLSFGGGSIMIWKRIVPVILLSVFLLATWVAAQESSATNVSEQIRNAKDIEAVRMVILREIEGFFNGNPAQVMSCYDADNFVGYGLRGNPDPKTWIINAVGREDLQKYADSAKTKMADKYPGITHEAEVKHVHVKGSNALAVSCQHMVIPDKAKNSTATVDFESVFLLKKNAGGVWKITGWLGTATLNREVIPE